MAIDTIAGLAQALGQASPPARAQSAGYDFSLNDIARFEAAYRGSPSPPAAPAPQVMHGAAASPASLIDAPALRVMFHPLERINLDAAKLAKTTRGGEMTPKEMLLLSVRSHEFLFHCELTSNVANRTSEGVQQLFRQQS
jgi:hypothetical protein